jgi:hypothetical protein
VTRRSMKRQRPPIRGVTRALAGTLVLGVAMVGALVAAPPASGAEPAGQGDPCGRSSWLAGTTELCNGALVYRDYVMDDHGASDPTDPTSETEVLAPLSPTAGDARNPDRSRAGTADLIDLTLRIRGNQLVAVFQLNALYHADSTIAALAIDTDNDAASGGGGWPGLGVSSRGWDRFATAGSGDAGNNTITLTMAVPSGTQWRVQAVTAQADGTVMNVAYRGIDELSGFGTDSTWWEGRQAAALADGDISRFGAEVAVADLKNRVTRPADHTAPGFHLRVFTSNHTVGSGEGYSYEGEYGRRGKTGAACEQRFSSLGRFQPYAVYVPTGGSADAAATLVACDALWTTGLPREALAEIAADIGADVPFLLHGGTALGTGYGEQVSPVLARGGQWHWVAAWAVGGLSPPGLYREFVRLRFVW